MGEAVCILDQFKHGKEVRYSIKNLNVVFMALIVVVLDIYHKQPVVNRWENER